MNSQQLTQLVVDALDDLKAVDLRVIDVRDKTSITDVMVIATGTSSRHVKSLANTVAEKAKENGVIPLGLEGLEHSEWALVDLGDVVVHVMQAEVRAFYQLEKLWETEAVESAASAKR